LTATPQQICHILELVTKHADRPADVVDASLIALAERFDTFDVATFDLATFDSDFEVCRVYGRRKC